MAGTSMARVDLDLWKVTDLVVLLMAEIRLTTNGPKDDDCPIIYRVEKPSQVVVWDFVHQQ